eukprot:scaffold129857_cov66-Phaeocystis_antarctica.AAC.3
MPHMATSTRVARGSGRSGAAIAFVVSWWWCRNTSICRDARRTVVLLKGCNPSREIRSARSDPSSSSTHSAYAACITCSGTEGDESQRKNVRKGTDCELTSSGVGLPSAACAMDSTTTDACKNCRAHADNGTKGG